MPPPLPIVRGVWEKVKLVERAAGVAVSSGLIQVSVRAMRLRPEWVAIEGIKSALFTADWQFQRPIGTDSKVVEDRGTVRRLLGLALPPTYSACSPSVSSNSTDLKAHSEYN